MDTPENTNRMVLSDMLDEFSSGSGSGSVLIVEISEEENVWTCNKTWQEIHDAYLVGPVILSAPDQQGDGLRLLSVISVSSFDGYKIYYAEEYNNCMDCQNADDYPRVSFN